MWGKRKESLLEFNARYTDQLAALYSSTRCGNPDCNIPLDAEKANHRVLSHGEVCELCYEMYTAVNKRVHFVNAHAEWDEENKQRAEYVRRIKKG